MTSATSGSVPGLGRVIVEQLRAVGLAVRREVAALTAVVAFSVLGMAVVVMVPSLSAQVDLGDAIQLNPEGLGYMAALVAVFFPLAVWKGDSPWGEAHLWTLPVARPQHALIKVGAGWVYLMGTVAMGLLGIVVTALMAGGSLGIETTRLLAAAGPPAEGQIADAVAVVWRTPLWQWLTLFTGATAVYLFSSVLWLATARPWHWVVGLWLSALVIAGLVDLLNQGPLVDLTYTAVGSADRLLMGGAEMQSFYAQTAPDEWNRVWAALPSARGWATSTALWIGAGLVALVAAARRHRDG